MSADLNLPALTARQLEVLELVAKGLTNAEIAGVLEIAASTAKNHVSAVLHALDVTNRTEAVGILESIRGNEVASSAAVPGFGHRPAIAVMPFEALGAEEETRFFARGLTEDVIARISAWRWFPVISRASIESYCAGTQFAGAISVGAALGVRYVLEGSVRRSGDRMRVGAALVDASNGEQLWSERFDRQVEDFLVLQDEIVDAIVGAAAPAIARIERIRSARARVPEIGAWELLQKGLEARTEMTAEANERARAYFREAVDRDPHFAPAWSSMAQCALTDAMLGFVSDPPRAVLEGLEIARRAVEVDPLDPVGQTMLGGALGLLKQEEAAHRALRRALELDPSSALACLAYGIGLLKHETADEARHYFERALRLSPLDPLAADFAGGAALAAYLAEEYEVALDRGRQSIAAARDVGFQYAPIVVASLTRLGRNVEAREEAVRFRQRFPQATLKDARFFVGEEVLDDLTRGLAAAGFVV